MLKKTINWQLSFVVAIVSICSLVLIQQYVMAQGGWVDPDTLPGATPSNSFVVNPLADDLQLNNHNILGNNLIIDGSGNTNAITITGGRKLCLGGTCQDNWTTVSGFVKGSGIVGKIPIFTAADTIGNSNISHIANGQYTLGVSGAANGGLLIYTNGDSGANYPALDISLGDWNSNTGIDISNISRGKSIDIDDQRNNLDTIGRSSVYLRNAGYGNGLFISQENNAATSTTPGRPLRINDTINDPTPFVVDWDGRVGIGTVSPNKNLHIQTASGNAEIDIQTGTTANGHWGIYHDNATNDLFFWKNPENRVIFTDDGNINLWGSVCDINGNNCFTPGVGTNYWTKEATSNTISRAESNVYLVANLQALPAAATGSSSRFVWYPNKSAIRAGAVNTTYWDDTSIGTYSVAFGYNSQAAASKSTVSGGESNRISDSNAGLSATIGGGYNNQIIKSVQGTIAGGGSNSIGTGVNSKNAAVISGGINNVNNGSSAVIGGGGYNNIDGDSSFIGGGYTNSVAGQYASILGGAFNKADGDYSFAGGKNMQLSATADRTFAWGYSETPVSITRDNSVILFPTNPSGSVPRLGIGTSAPNSTVHVKSNSGNAEIDLQSGSSPYWGIYQDDATDELRFWNNGVNKVIFKSNSLGVVSAPADGVNNYIQLDQVTAPPVATDCDATSEYGRAIFMTDPLLDAGTLFICNITGWSRVNLSFS